MKNLEKETSPYLLQHAANPVDWYPWGPEALAAARESNRPILLSIGYSACHWCHVMAHESFEDGATAKIMNARYINVKVDREERPDLDRIYQLSHQLLTQRAGGWPLTMFLTPDDQLPFFGGTYFPNEARHGLPAFRDILVRVSEYFNEHRDEIEEQHRELKNVYAKIEASQASDSRLTRAPINDVRSALEQQFDSQNGGFGRAPKFPNSSGLERLLRHWRATAETSKPDIRALYMATFSLRRMSESGLFDHLGGGFFRYTVDAAWTIPHFEKMLYDNALLLALYAQAGQATGDRHYLQTAMHTADWLLEGMRDASGGFFATLDADSEGEEGKYYVWGKDEIFAALNSDELEVFAARFGLDGSANFEGAWHLVAATDEVNLEVKLKREPRNIAARLATGREKLLALRAKRVPPHRDEKVLTAWNALAVRGLAIAARSLDRTDLADAATRVIDFIRESLYENGRLKASFKDGQARFNAYLDDYAYLVDALVELLITRWRSADLEFAISLADTMLEHFEDQSGGGFYFTSDDHEELIQRLKPFADDATPSGNAIAIRALMRLGALLAETRYLDASERALKAGYDQMAASPSGHSTLIDALDDFLEPPSIVIVRYNGELEPEWNNLRTGYDPKRLVFFIPAGATGLPDALTSKKPGELTTAYVCRGLTCSEPATSPDRLIPPDLQG